MLTHVVVTIYIQSSEAKPVVHTYGPYTPGRAASERKKIIDSHWWLTEGETLLVICRKMIDVDAINAAATSKVGTL